MRKKLVLVLALVMIVSTALPGVAFAKEDPGLEDAIKRVKQLLVIPEENSEFSIPQVPAEVLHCGIWSGRQKGMRAQLFPSAWTVQVIY